MSNIVASTPILPFDIWTHVGLFLTFRPAVIMYTTCRELRERYRRIIEEVIIPAERARMRITTFPVALAFTLFLPDEETRILQSAGGRRLYADFVAGYWWNRSPEECGAIRRDLEAQPLEYYERLNPARVVLEDNILNVRSNPRELYDRVMEEKEINRALILARRIRGIFNIDLYSRAIDVLALRKGLSLKTALHISSMEPMLRARASTISRIVLEKKLPLPTALKILKHISMSDSDLRDELFETLALQEDHRLETCIEIALQIINLKRRSETLSKLARKNRCSLQAALEIVQKIPSKVHQDSLIVALLSKESELVPETAIKIALAIDHVDSKIEALKEIAQQKECTDETRKELNRQINRWETYKKLGKKE